jgi:hypothetical protein
VLLDEVLSQAAETFFSTGSLAPKKKFRASDFDLQTPQNQQKCAHSQVSCNVIIIIRLIARVQCGRPNAYNFSANQIAQRKKPKRCLLNLQVCFPSSKERRQDNTAKFGDRLYRNEFEEPNSTS